MGKKMICLVGSSCFEVIDSKYGKTFGIKNEMYGFIYYAILIVYSTIGLIILEVTALAPFIFIATLLGALFSVYLFIIQSMILKKYCSYCLIAIFINILIFGYMLFIIG